MKEYIITIKAEFIETWTPPETKQKNEASIFTNIEIVGNKTLGIVIY